MTGRKSSPPGGATATTAPRRLEMPVELSQRLERIERRAGIPRALALMLGLAAVALVINLVRDQRDIVAPVFLAINLMLAASPLQSWLARHIHKALAAAISGVLVILFLFAFFYSLGWSLVSLIQEIPQYSQQFTDLYTSILDLAARFGISSDQIAEQVRGINPQSIVGVAGSVLSNLSGAASLLAVVLTVIFFLALDSISMGNRMDIMSRQHARFTEALRSFGEGVRRYWVVTTVFGLIVAILDGVFLMIYGVPLAMAWAVLAFVTNYIPNIGFVIGLVPPALMALLAKGPIAALVVVIVFSVLNFTIQSLIQPKFTGDAVGVTPTVSFLSLLFWAAVMGPLGALLALPATLLVKAILVDADPDSRWANALIAADPTTAEADSTAEAFHGDDEPDEGPGGAFERGSADEAMTEEEARRAEQDGSDDDRTDKDRVDGDSAGRAQ